MSSIDSQNELWDNFKKSNHIRSHTTDYHFEKGSTGDSTTLKKNLDTNGIPTNGDEPVSAGLAASKHHAMLEKYERNLEKVKESHRIELQNLTITFHNKAKDMISSKIEEMRAKFEEEIRNIMSDSTRTKIILKEKENQITKLTCMLDEKEIMIEQYHHRLEVRPNTTGHKLDNTGNFEENLAHKDETIEYLKSELQSVNSLCNLYKVDEAKASEDLIDCQKKMEDFNLEYQNRIKIIEEESLNTIENLKASLKKVESE